MMARIAPVPKHLATTTHRVVRLGKEMAKDVGRGNAKGKERRQIAIMRNEIIACGIKGKSKTGRAPFVPGAGDGKMNAPLTAQLPDTLVHEACQEHRAVKMDRVGRGCHGMSRST